MREADLERLLAESRLTIEVVLADVPPELLHEEDDTILEIGDEKDLYIKLSSYDELERACQAEGSCIRHRVLRVYVMPYIPLTCCRSLEEVFSEDDGLCCGTRISIENLPFLQNQLRVLNTLSVLLENCLDISAELGMFLHKIPLPNTEAKELSYERFLAAREGGQRDFLSIEFELYVENALYDIRKSRADILQATLDNLELMNETLNDACIGYSILSDAENDLCNNRKEVFRASCLRAKDKRIAGEGENKQPIALVESSVDSLEANNQHFLIDSGGLGLRDADRETTLTASDMEPHDTGRGKNGLLKAEETLSQKDSHEDVFVDVPYFLMSVPDHIAVQVEEKFWIRVSDFDEFESFCEKEGLTKVESLLQVQAMPGMSLKAC